jgi:hypothetical protein
MKYLWVFCRVGFFVFPLRMSATKPRGFVSSQCEGDSQLKGMKSTGCFKIDVLDQSVSVRVCYFFRQVASFLPMGDRGSSNRVCFGATTMKPQRKLLKPVTRSGSLALKFRLRAEQMESGSFSTNPAARRKDQMLRQSEWIAEFRRVLRLFDDHRISVI